MSSDICRPHGAQQQTLRTPWLRSRDGTDRQTDGRTDGRTHDRIIDTATTAATAATTIISLLKPSAHLTRNEIYAASGRGVW